MRAFVLTSFDGPTATALTEVADPVTGDDSVLVAVQAAGVGAWDAQTSGRGLNVVVVHRVAIAGRTGVHDKVGAA
jgi:NADPH:quinone reductase-like Zn-dependent oxidoreductase